MKGISAVGILSEIQYFVVKTTIKDILVEPEIYLYLTYLQFYIYLKRLLLEDVENAWNKLDLFQLIHSHQFSVFRIRILGFSHQNLAHFFQKKWTERRGLQVSPG